MVNLLAKACVLKTIGVKTTVIPSAIFAVGLLNLKKKKKHGGFCCFLPGGQASYFSYLGVSFGREMLE